jgi:hypothetical protein
VDPTKFYASLTIFTTNILKCLHIRKRIQIPFERDDIFLHKKKNKVFLKIGER